MIFFNLLMKGGIGLSFYNLISCGDSKKGILSHSDVSGRYSDKEVNFANEVINSYCSDNYDGLHLKETERCLSKINNTGYGSARDKVVVIDDFDIINTEFKPECIVFSVKYKYYGVIKGEIYHTFNPKKDRDRYLTFKFKVHPSSEGFTVSKKLPSFCSKSKVQEHFEMLIQRSLTKPRNEKRSKVRLTKLINIIDELNKPN